MSSRKLSESDKSDIIDLYRQPGETTLTLASRYGVSSSTISRILKSTLSEEEYESLIQQKRSGRFIPSDPDPLDEKEEGEQFLADPRQKRIRLRSASDAAEEEDKNELELPVSGFNDRYPRIETSALQEMLGEDILDEDDEDDELEDDEELEDEDDEDDDEEWEDDEPLLRRVPPRTSTVVEVLPLAEAELPKICYVVVDKGGDLITRPLKEFAELGQIPAQESYERTLPVFDNHRVARRFSARNQRVIKVPDGRMLQKTSVYLQSKGITRLLIDGQVYSL
ncbi:transposase [Phormidium pseudopriestleyi FRX01]|uniref:Transposase n=1 Tax=Phormidium pseudopriestleyi FRX01 TaxID=1759528 RepID=A0ABS3FTY6_9CYAN|nr:transposase [Phormidium pseudopriestleyi]MBO0350570.1 transposase [Phormidium pseudopriestleyi FRX01]